jgi:hypothetical protein
MHKNATKCNETLSKWCKNKHGASKIMDTLETYHITSEKPNDHRGLRRLGKVKHFVSIHQVNPNKASKENTTIICSHIIKTTHDSFKGTLSNLSHLRQAMLEQKSKPWSKQAPICTTIGMKHFSLFSNTNQPF